MSASVSQQKSEIMSLLSHRPPMLLIDRIVAISSNRSTAEVIIDSTKPFFEQEHGVPSTIGLEFIGQTAALIAGLEALDKPTESVLGFLLGTRKYQATTEYFKQGSVLVVDCVECAVVGETLVSFDCEIRYKDAPDVIASATISVLRKSMESGSDAH